MKKYFVLFGIFFFTSFFCLSQEITKGKVVRVSDGDTMTILNSMNKRMKIRFYGIDCPENGQDFANVARKFTTDLCFSKTVSVEIKNIDQYGRIVGIVYLNDTVNVNLELLEAGLAWHYKSFDKSKVFAKAALDAKRHKKGLWKQRNALAPWKYRKLKR